MNATSIYIYIFSVDSALQLLYPMYLPKQFVCILFVSFYRKSTLFAARVRNTRGNFDQNKASSIENYIKGSLIVIGFF